MFFFFQLSFYKKAIEDMAKESLRCVAVAYRNCEVDTVPTSEDKLENWQLPEDELILLAIAGIKVRKSSLAIASPFDKQCIQSDRHLALNERYYKKNRGACGSDFFMLLMFYGTVTVF